MLHKSNKKVSLIILTYNRPDALSLVLKSIEHQTELPFEVIIADDGSTDDTRLLIQTIQQEISFPVKHVWHEDQGFRIAKIRNKAVRASNGDFLIFSDGDLFFHPCFITDFMRNAKKGWALIGSRVFLTQKTTITRVNQKNVLPVASILSREIEKNRLNSLRIPFLSRMWGREERGDRLRGGLLGVWRSDLEAVNGWDEDFVGWGREDTELVYRLMNNQVAIKKLKLQALTYHLWHQQASRKAFQKNQKLLEETICDKRIRCANGLISIPEV